MMRGTVCFLQDLCSGQFPLPSRPASFKDAKKCSDVTLPSEKLTHFCWNDRNKKQNKTTKLLGSSNRTKGFKQYISYTILFPRVRSSVAVVPGARTLGEPGLSVEGLPARFLPDACGGV